MAGEAELALLSPLRAGSPLSGYEIARIQAVHEGRLTIVCKKKDTTVRLAVTLASDDGPSPPARAGRYAIYYSVRQGTKDDAEALALALAKVLEANASAPVPAGLAPFVPGPRSGTRL